MTKQNKNYVSWVNDHSGSMATLANAARDDFNANMTAVKNAASAEKLDTVVSVFGIGGNVERQVVISNPHVLEPVQHWRAGGGTPLFRGTLELIKMLEQLPDANEPHVAFLIRLTTDGDDTAGGKSELAAKIAEKQRLGNWTFAARIPRGGRYYLNGLNIPEGNITEWDTTEEGLRQATAQDAAATTAYFAGRSAGVKSSNTFYAQAAAVDTSKLVDISSKVSVYQVGAGQMGIQIKDFILTKRMEYLIGAAFYQLTKTEPRVSPTKLILIREKATGKVFAGKDARTQLGLPNDGLKNARLHPGDHGAYEIYIQSESWNRKLVEGSLVLYWAEKGRPMTQADLDKYAGQNNVAAPAVLQGLPVAPTNKPTPSPIPVTKKVVDLTVVNGRKVYSVYDTRQEAREAGARMSPVRFVQDIRDFPGMALVDGKRWFLFE